MSEIKVNKISPRTNCGTTTLGDSGDTFTIPAGVTITNNGTQTGFGRTGTVDWQTGSIKTGTFTAVSGEGYFCNTTAGSFEVDLPAGSAGAIVSIQDYNNTFDSNSLTVDPNGSEKINGGSAGDPVTLDTEGQGVTFVYIDSTVGWRSVQDNTYATQGALFITATGGTITTCGNDKIHTFTGPGTFTVCNVATCSANNIVSYVVVAGGGAGGKCRSGGGGAGGYREVKSPVTPYTASPLDGYCTPANRVTVTATSFPITVGGGGAGTSCNTTAASSGSNSTFSTITSAGGGFGRNDNPAGNPPTSGGGNGGSGGGGANSTPGGTGNTPPVSPSQGTNGANALSGSAGGGGGGATQAGQQGPGPLNGGNGGNGATSNITGSPVARAGGGGGGSGPSSAGTGGTGGGADGVQGNPSTTAGNAGTDNTGGGGGGTGEPGGTSGAGGSGIVIIRYKFQ